MTTLHVEKPAAHLLAGRKYSSTSLEAMPVTAVQL